MDNFKNFAKVTVSTGYNASATSVVLSSGHGAKFPTAPFNAVWWNATDYADPSDDPNVEVVRVTAISTDTLTVTRGQESITATTKNTASKTYKMVAAFTAKTINTELVGNTGTGVGSISLGDGGSHTLTLTTQTMSADATIVFPSAPGSSGFMFGTVSGSNISLSQVGSSGTGSVVLTTSPTLVTPTLGVATATSINGSTVPSSDTLVGRATTDTLTNKTLTNPTIGSFTNATHTHQNAAGGGTLDAAAIASGTLPVARGGTNSPTIIGALDNFVTAEATVASATTTDLGAQTSINLQITGTTTITGLGTVAAGVIRHVRLAGSLTLTHNATSLILPGGANITTAANDRFTAVSLGSGNWLVRFYQKADGTAIVGAAGGGDASTNTSSSVDSEVALFSGTGGKTIKRATGTGIPKLTSGVQSIATQGTDYLAPVTEASIASASTTDLGSNASTNASVTGTTTITSLGSTAPTGKVYFVRFASALTLTHNATSLILPGAANIAVAAGASMIAEHLGSGNWKVLNFSRADGTSVVIRDFFEFSLSDETTAITTGTAKVTWRAPFAFTILSTRASVTTVSSSGIPTVNIKQNGTTVFSTKLTIDASEKTSVTAATAAVLSATAIADDDEITFDIDVAGTGAAGLKVKIYYSKP